MAIRLSKAGKMPCRSWSLQALTTCPGSIGDKGTLVDACRGCYATAGNYRFPSVKQPRESNQKDWKRAAWVSDMVAELDNDRYFRWFDSGDVYSLKLAEKILAVMQATPWVKHWLPTRMHKFVKFHGVFAAMESLPNVVVRYSSDSVTGKVVAGRNTSTIVSSLDSGNGIPHGVRVKHQRRQVRPVSCMLESRRVCDSIPGTRQDNVKINQSKRGGVV
jgi:hypothetical protein